MSQKAKNDGGFFVCFYGFDRVLLRVAPGYTWSQPRDKNQKQLRVSKLFQLKLLARRGFEANMLRKALVVFAAACVGGELGTNGNDSAGDKFEDNTLKIGAQEQLS